MISRNVIICICVLIRMIFASNDTGPPIVSIHSNGVDRSEIDINCHVTSYSVPTINWFKKDDFEPSELRTGKNKQDYWSNITINYPNINDKFTCVAENSYGKANASYIIPCYEGECLEWDDDLQENKTINVGQTHSVLCKLQTQHAYINQCFKFGVSHNNRSYIKRVSITPPVGAKKGLSYTISYSYNITHATTKDTGVYLCYYIKNFTTRPDAIHCHFPTVKRFNLLVTDRQSSERGRNIKIAVAMSVGSVLLGLVLVVSIFCLRRKKLKSQRLYESDPELRWDVFVSYSSKDFDWVKELCKTLEQPPFNLNVCLHQRDWEVGRTILDNMAESIYCSCKTLLILSKSYLESSFCMKELNIAMDFESLPQKTLKDRVIVIKLDDVSLKNLPKSLRQKSYLDFSNDEQRKHYKTKLLKALPRREQEEAQSEESGNEAQSEETGNEAISEESGNEAQSEETGNEAMSEETGNEALSEETGTEALSEEPGNENMEHISLHTIIT